MEVILLAAGVGKRLAPYTEVRPKCLMEVQGVSLLERHITHCAVFGAKRITVVTGHLSAMIEEEIRKCTPRIPVRLVHNEAFRKGSVLSLKAGLAQTEGDIVFMDTDVLYHPTVLERLFRSTHASCLLVDGTAEESGEEMMVGIRKGRAAVIARRIQHLGPFDQSGESVGFFRIAKRHRQALDNGIAQTIAADGDNSEYEQALNRIFGAVEVGYETVDGLPWTEIDFAEDLQKAKEVVAPLIPKFNVDRGTLHSARTL